MLLEVGAAAEPVEGADLEVSKGSTSRSAWPITAEKSSRPSAQLEPRTQATYEQGLAPEMEAKMCDMASKMEAKQLEMVAERAASMWIPSPGRFGRSSHLDSTDAIWHARSP